MAEVSKTHGKFSFQTPKYTILNEIRNKANKKMLFDLRFIHLSSALQRTWKRKMLRKSFLSNREYHFDGTDYLNKLQLFLLHCNRTPRYISNQRSYYAIEE